MDFGHEVEPTLEVSDTRYWASYTLDSIRTPVGALETQTRVVTVDDKNKDGIDCHRSGSPRGDPLPFSLAHEVHSCKGSPLGIARFRKPPMKIDLETDTGRHLPVLLPNRHSGPLRILFKDIRTRL
jgi:hypothetical protein